MTSVVDHSDLTEALRLLVELANCDPSDPDELREALRARRVSGIQTAPDDQVLQAGETARTIADMATSTSPDSLEELNGLLDGLPLRPHMVAHDDLPPHLHWTLPQAPFAQQVEADLAMATAIAITVGHATRVRNCAATDCDRFIYDETRNGSTRYCPDRQCANRSRQQRHRQRSAS